MDIQSSRRREPDCDTQGYLLILARTAVSLANGIQRSYSFICVMFPGRHSRMPYGIDLLHYRRLLLCNNANRRFGRSVHHLFLAWSCGYQKHGMDKRRLGSVGLASRVNLSAEIGSSGSGLREVAREDGLEERTEDDLGTTECC